MFGKKQKSGNVAKSRLQVVLFQDRMKMSPKVLEMLKTDILNVIAQYMEIDHQELDIKISPTQIQEQNDGLPSLVANIPIKGLKRSQK